MVSVLFVISNGNLVYLPLYSVSTHTFPRNVISFLFTPWYLSFNGWIFSGLYSVGLFGIMVTGEPINNKLLIFSVYFYFDAIVVVVVRCYFVDWCDLEYLFGFTVFIFFFGGHIFQVVDSFCFVWFCAAYPGEVSCFLAVVAFYRFRRAVVLGCPILLSAESAVVFFCFGCSRYCFVWIFWIGSCFISLSSPMRVVCLIVYVGGHSCLV